MPRESWAAVPISTILIHISQPRCCSGFPGSSWGNVPARARPGCLVGAQKVECSINKVIRINTLLKAGVFSSLSKALHMPHVPCVLHTPCWAQAAAQGSSTPGREALVAQRWPSSPESWDAAVLQRDFVLEGLLEGGKLGFLSWWALQSWSVKATESSKSCQSLNNPSSIAHFGVSTLGANELHRFAALSALPSYCSGEHWALALSWPAGSSQSENGLFPSLCSIGNMDRHHYETFEKFGNETFIIHLDNGRG